MNYLTLPNPHHSDAQPKALAMMPVEWVEQLHQAATKVNAKQIHKLIEQNPKANVSLANALTYLVNNFCCEEIVLFT